jgi:hypothetical protein
MKKLLFIFLKRKKIIELLNLIDSYNEPLDCKEYFNKKEKKLYSLENSTPDEFYNNKIIIHQWYNIEKYRTLTKNIITFIN